VPVAIVFEARLTLLYTGDGVTDDTAAINSAISSGTGRCGNGSCPSSTTAPAVVYFPAGTYIISSPIVLYYYTQMIGDARNLPTLKATAGFSGIAVVDADPYLAGGVNWYTNQNNFFRSVRNFVVDIRNIASGGTGIHWQVSQATSLTNVRVEMSTAAGTTQQGIFMVNSISLGVRFLTDRALARKTVLVVTWAT
jgi:glucan 1,3-beta-glucosidase